MPCRRSTSPSTSFYTASLIRISDRPSHGCSAVALSFSRLASMLVVLSAQQAACSGGEWLPRRTSAWRRCAVSVDRSINVGLCHWTHQVALNSVYWYLMYRRQFTIRHEGECSTRKSNVLTYTQDVITAIVRRRLCYQYCVRWIVNSDTVSSSMRSLLDWSGVVQSYLGHAGATVCRTGARLHACMMHASTHRIPILWNALTSNFVSLHRINHSSL